MKFLLPFHHDTSLIFATRFERQLREGGHEVSLVELVEPDGKERISDRQRATYLPDRRVLSVDIERAGQPDFYDGYNAVAVCVPVAPLRRLLRRRRYMSRKDRPRFIAFFPGMEFTPHIGMRGRRDFDAIFLNHAEHEALYRKHFMRPGQFVSWGHPYFTRPERFIDESDGRKDVYFFAQAITPSTKRSRMHVVEVLAAIARAHPDRNVVIKLRHLTNENQHHVHKEEWSYEKLVDELQSGRPDNLTIDTGTTDAALAKAAYCITCTSTAAMDAISAGVATAVYLDYPDFWQDPLNHKMRCFISGSSLSISLLSLIELNIANPSNTWAMQNFRNCRSFMDDFCSASEF